MATHHQTGELEGPFATDDPVRLLLEFYLANGYRLVERDGAQPAATDADDPAQVPDTQGLASARLERGKAGNGWWTSNMTELHTVVDIAVDDDAIMLNYEVDTSGQMLNDVERAFWQRELEWASRYAQGKIEEPVDLREREEKRAKEQSDNLVSIGLWGAVAIFMVIVALGFMGII